MRLFDIYSGTSIYQFSRLQKYIGIVDLKIDENCYEQTLASLP